MGAILNSTPRHNDWDLQNIICSDTGEVIRIIDWDKILTVPRCAGFSNIPLFLQEDWCYGDCVLSEESIRAHWALNKDHKIYAGSMIAMYGRNSDAKYTAKSHLYSTIQANLFGDNGEYYARNLSFVPKLLAETPGLRRVAVEP